MKLITNHLTIEIRDDIIICDFNKPVFVDYETAKDIEYVIRGMSEGKIMSCLIIIGSEFKGFSKKASEHLSEDLIAECFECCGVVIDGFASYLISKVFVVFGDHKVPLMVFNNKDIALQWVMDVHIGFYYDKKKRES